MGDKNRITAHSFVICELHKRASELCRIGISPKQMNFILNAMSKDVLDYLVQFYGQFRSAGKVINEVAQQHCVPLNDEGPA